MFANILYRRQAYGALLMTLTLFLSAGDSIAQAPKEKNGSAPALPANSQLETRPMYVQGAVVVLLVGAAIYAVCRSSRRV